MQLSNKEIVERFITGDRDAVRELLHPDARCREAESLWYGGDWVGPEQFLEMGKTVWSKAKFVVDKYAVREAEDNRVSVHIELTFTSRASGESLATSISEIYTVADGQITDIDVYYKDTKALLDLVAN